jgi:hypothetical protein
VHNVSDVCQIEVHTAEPLVPCPSCLEVETAIANLKYKLPGRDQILAELIQAGGETLLSLIPKLSNSIRNKEARLIKMCLNETHSKVCTGKHLSERFPIQNGLKQGDALSPLLFNFALEYSIRKVL